MDNPLAPSMTLELLGTPAWHTADGRRDLLNRQDAVLLALLALDGPQGRDVLAGQIWPEATQTTAGNNLRKHISRLRRDSGQPMLRTGDARLELLAQVRVDLNHLAELSPSRLLEGELLGGFDYSDLDHLHDWVTQRREALRLRRADAAAGQAEDQERRGELAAAIRLAEGIVALAPQQEHAWRRLMRLHYLRGDHTAAIAAFERFEAWLHDQTGARPGPETRRLLDTIERGAAARQAVAVVPVCLVRPPLRVGREAEWLAMGRAWSALRPFLLLGEAGIGKSRLLVDFAQAYPSASTSTTGPALLLERARAGDAPSPYALLARMLRAMLALPLPEPAGMARAELARLLPELGPAPQSPAQQAPLRHVAEGVFIAAQRAGLAGWLVDDLHLADLASLETLRWLCASQALAGLRFGFAARPLDDAEAGVLLRSWLDDSQRPERIDLRPLAPGDAVALLASLDLPELAADPDFGRRLHAHAGGQPLYMLETLKDAWLHRRDLAHEPLPAPRSVLTLIERRLAELPPAALELLRVAAVAGADLTPERAAHLLDSRPMALVDAWHQLERANVLQGARFAHDLLQDCALAAVPLPLRQLLHARMAALLASDPTVPAARVAGHWQSAERWPEAGQAWQRAGQHARLAGRLLEQQTLLEQAAACCRQAGDRAGEFGAVALGCDGLLLRHGGAAVLAVLPRLESLAVTEAHQVQCRVLQAEALLDQRRSAEALAAAHAALRLAARHPLWLADAHAMQGTALAQLGRADEAVAAIRSAADAAHAVASPEQEMRAQRALAYVLFSAGRLGDALPVQRRAMALAEALGDEGEAAAAEASLAALLSASGQVAASLEHAAHARQRYRDMGLAANSSFLGTVLITLGNAAASLGRFDEALEALELAVRMSGEQANAQLHPKALLALAMLRLWLGDPAAARALAAEVPAGAAPGMRMIAALTLALADEWSGRDAGASWARLGRLGAEHPDLPLVQSAWIEWSYQGEPRAVVERLRRVHDAFAAQGLPGTARSVRLRELARLLELDDAAAATRAVALADELRPHMSDGSYGSEGLHAKTYPPEGWLVLARAFERAGREADAGACRQAAQDWVLRRALPHVPAAAREAFLAVNPYNREALAASRA